MKNRGFTKQRAVLWVAGILLVILIVCVMIFFSTYEVKSVEIRGNARYSDEDVKEMVLKGFFANNSVLAPFFCSNDGSEGIYLVDSWSVTQLSRNSIAINFKEKKPVGCIRYLDNYVYFDRNGIFVDASMIREEKIPYFNGIVVHEVVENEKLPIKGSGILNTAVTLATIFQKDEKLPDYVEFDKKNQVSLVYENLTVNLGKSEYLEDKMARVVAILPQIEGRKGILHLESVTENIKTVTFEEEEPDVSSLTPEEWPGGYDENGNYTGDGEYTEKGKYVGPRPLGDLENAIANWAGGYDGEGDYTGSGEYDAGGKHVGKAPDETSFAALGDWAGGYTEEGKFNWTGEYDRYGNYVGPYTPPAETAGTEETGETAESSSIESYFSTDSEDGGSSMESGVNMDYGDGSYDDGSYDDGSYDDGSYDDGSYDSYDYSETEDGGIYDEAYYDALYEGIYW